MFCPLVEPKRADKLEIIQTDTYDKYNIIQNNIL